MNNWITLVGYLTAAAIVVFIVLEYRKDRQRDAAEDSDSARLDLLEKYGLVVLPPTPGDGFLVMRRRGTETQLLGAGGPTLRSAIDEAMFDPKLYEGVSDNG